jgi:hypothetical protein
MPASSSDRSDAGAPTVAETSLATRTATCPYIESMIESLRQAGDRPVLRWDGADTTGSQLLAAIYRLPARWSRWASHAATWWRCTRRTGPRHS